MCTEVKYVLQANVSVRYISHLNLEHYVPLIYVFISYFQHVRQVHQQQDSYKVSNFTFYKERSVLIVDTDDITCSTIILKIKCEVGSKPFSFSVSAVIECNSFETIGEFSLICMYRVIFNIWQPFNLPNRVTDMDLKNVLGFE